MENLCSFIYLSAMSKFLPFSLISRLVCGKCSYLYVKNNFRKWIHMWITISVITFVLYFYKIVNEL